MFIRIREKWLGKGQSGFTLVELMVTMSLSAFLLIVLFTIWLQTAAMGQEMVTRVALNQEVRNVVKVVGEGGRIDQPQPVKGLRFSYGPASQVTDDDTGDDELNLTNPPGATPVDYVRLTGDFNDPDDPSDPENYNTLEVWQNRVVVSQRADNAAPNPDTDWPRVESTRTTLPGENGLLIACTGVGAPHPDCPNGGDTILVGGYVSRITASRYSDGTNNQKNGDVGSRTMGVEIQLTDPFQAAAREPIPMSNYVHTYRTHFMMRDEDGKR